MDLQNHMNILCEKTTTYNFLFKFFYKLYLTYSKKSNTIFHEKVLNIYISYVKSINDMKKKLIE